MRNCFWDTETTGQTVGYCLSPSDPGTIDNVQGLVTALMQTEVTYTNAGWDFLNLWWINEGRDYPKLDWQPYGDLNNDSLVNLYDLAVMADAWLAVSGEGNYNSVCELSGDTSIDVADLSILAEMWLEGPQFPPIE